MCTHENFPGSLKETEGKGRAGRGAGRVRCLSRQGNGDRSSGGCSAAARGLETGLGSAVLRVGPVRGKEASLNPSKLSCLGFRWVPRK